MGRGNRGRRGGKQKGKPTQKAPNRTALRRSRFQQLRRGVLAIVSAPDDLGRAFASTPGRPLASISVVGTAFLVDASGIALTAAHVVRPWMTALRAFEQGKGTRPETIKIALPARSTVGDTESRWEIQIGPVSHVVMHEKYDVAAIRFLPPPNMGLEPLPLSADFCEDGDEVIVAGFPFGLDLHQDQLGGAGCIMASFAQGIVSAALPFPGAPAPVREAFQMAVMVNGGNSGGPVVSTETGRVIGVVSSSMMVNPAPAPKGAMEAGRAPLPMPTGIARATYVHRAMPLVGQVKNLPTLPVPPAGQQMSRPAT